MRYFYIGTGMFFLIFGWLLSDGYAYKQNTSNEGYPIAWPTNEVVLNLQLGCPANDICWNAVAAAAAEEWNDVGANFQFVIQDPSIDADPCDRGDGINTLAWMPHECGVPFAFNLTAKARGRAQGRHGDQEWAIINSDILFNTRRNWDVYSGPERFGVVDFYRVALHELGHVLGLAHPDDHGQAVNAIMNRAVDDFDHLQPDDMRGIVAIYGCAIPDGCDYMDPPPPPMPINGECGQRRNACTIGTYHDVADTSEAFRWQCEGEHGGTTQQCEMDRPVHGQCGSLENQCRAGLFADRADTPETFRWRCLGQSGGRSTSCTLARPSPETETMGFLENPQDGALKSGVSVISGWVCDAEELEVSFDGGARLFMPYGSERPDTAGVCGDTDNGFGLLWNYNELGDGPHTVTLYVDGMIYTQVNFNVRTLGTNFLRGVTGQGTITLSDGTQVNVQWEETTQGFTITGYTP